MTPCELCESFLLCRNPPAKCIFQCTLPLFSVTRVGVLSVSVFLEQQGWLSSTCYGGRHLLPPGNGLSINERLGVWSGDWENGQRRGSMTRGLEHGVGAGKIVREQKPDPVVGIIVSEDRLLGLKLGSSSYSPLALDKLINSARPQVSLLKNGDDDNSTYLVGLWSDFNEFICKVLKRVHSGSFTGIALQVIVTQNKEFLKKGTYWSKTSHKLVSLYCKKYLYQDGNP